MPDGRFLSKTVATDEPLNRLTWQAQAVYMMTVPHLDRDGLITGHPLLLMAQVAPLRAAELVGIMPGIIREWIDAELVTCYQSDDQPALFFPGFLKHQRLPHYDRETPSRFSPPPGYARTDQGLIPVDAPAEPAQLVTDSGATPDLVRSQSGPTPPLKQQKDSRFKNQDSAQQKNSSNSTHARARGAPAAVAAPPGAEIKPEIYAELVAFRVTEPVLTEIASDGVELEDITGWIAHVRTKPDIKNPVGYCIKRWRAHDPPPEPPPDEEDPDSYEALKRKYIPAGWEDLVVY